jgi:predicted TIM-barrel fold metal-dependent hydrolase
MDTTFSVVDAQVHSWTHDESRHPWDNTYAASGPVAAANIKRQRELEMPAERLLREMTAVGVGAAIIVTPSIYGYDNGYPLEIAAANPGRFGVVGRVDPLAADLDEQVRRWRRTPHALALRSVVTSDAHRREMREGVVEKLFAAAERQDVPVCVFWPRHAADLAPFVRAHPRLQFVVDHLGMAQPPLISIDGDMWAGFEHVLALASYPNVAMKLSGAPSMSRQAFPYRDLWPYLHRLIDAFGLERVMWGSDFTRVAELHTYEQAVAFIRDTDELSPSDKERVLSRTVRDVFRWRA